MVFVIPGALASTRRQGTLGGGCRAKPLEEIDIVESGKNYGWNIMEGTLCFNPSTECNQTGLTLPVWNYTHIEGNAIIGGYVYHGSNTALRALTFMAIMVLEESGHFA